MCQRKNKELVIFLFLALCVTDIAWSLRRTPVRRSYYLFIGVLLCPEHWVFETDRLLLKSLLYGLLAAA